MNIFDIYREELHKAVAAYPGEYFWTGVERTNEVADKMIAAMKAGSYNKEGRAFKATVKRLGIKYTYTAQWYGRGPGRGMYIRMHRKVTS